MIFRCSRRFFLPLLKIHNENPKASFASQTERERKKKKGYRGTENGTRACQITVNATLVLFRV